MVDFLGFSVMPDVEELLDIIWRKKLPKRIHHIELFHDPEVVQHIADRFGLVEKLGKNDPAYKLKLNILVHQFIGSDVFHIPFTDEDFFKLRLNLAEDTAIMETSRGKRNWMEEHSGPIKSWEDFENYPWPEVNKIDFSSLEWMEKNLPENMGCYDLTGSILERLTWLMGYEALCMKIYDDPALVDVVCEKVGSFYEKYTESLCSFKCVPIIWGSDDMGFRTSTMVSPDFLRKKIFPWHRRCARIAHNSNKPYLLHSCGKLDEIMDDLIDDVKIDAKHSFEDAIQTVTEAFYLYSDRIAILGGIDVDFLCRSDEKSIRLGVQETLKICMEKPMYCLGTGNSVANYIPLDNYLAMIDEGRKFML